MGQRTQILLGGCPLRVKSGHSHRKVFGVRDFTKCGLVGFVDSFLNAPVEQVGERH
jgi:hypothetical protein